MPDHLRDFSKVSGNFGNCGSAALPAQSDFCSNRLSVFSKLLLPLLLIACVFVSSSALAQSGQPNFAIPPPDGGYSNDNTGESSDALFSLTDAKANMAIGRSTGHVAAEGFSSPVSAVFLKTSRGSFRIRVVHGVRSGLMQL
jgi:hypothetical protein